MLKGSFVHLIVPFVIAIPIGCLEFVSFVYDHFLLAPSHNASVTLDC